MSPAGRPEIGQPINIRLGDDLLSRVDALASDKQISRAESIRRLIAAALDGSDRAAVRLVTGFTDAELTDLGGFADDH